VRRSSVLVACALVVGGALLYWFVLRTQPVPTPGTTSPIAADKAEHVGSEAPQAPAKPRPVTKTSRIGKEKRAALAEMIRRSVEARRIAGASGSGASANPPPTLAAQADTEIVRTTMKDAMRELIPFLAECYGADEKLPSPLEIIADITLTGDPDIGTIADANTVKNKDGAPLPESFSTCLRDTLVEIEMPPLSEGGSVNVHYPFTFADDERTLPK
jgi:hypothetical protein